MSIITALANILHPRGEVALTNEQRITLAAVTRVASALSAIGVITIITTFSLSRHFRNPMHRLIFINAFYNAFDVVCTMISVSGYSGGNKSALYQFQGFLNQMFPVADVLWTLFMAIDVYLIVFRCYETLAVRRLEWKYMIGITTFTFIPAFIMLFIDTLDKGPMCGSVTFWCAIAPKWVLFPIVIYYVPIWSSILITMVLYILVGMEIARRRMAHDTAMSSIDDSYSNCDDFDTQLSPRHISTSYSADESLVSVSRLNPPKRSSLSFRQYVLMSLFFFLLSVWVAPSTNRVAAFIDPSFGSYPLLLAVGISGSLRGFWNGLVFITVGLKSWRRRNEEECAMHLSRDMRDDDASGTNASTHSATQAPARSIPDI
ncbi:hypothetical protein B0T14DRAFT_534061 [Immersiella caudata]|uniref:G-protein coupled receptors family 2 profile 2 domain-containing protein n=1 Tax=Immersiella caudata TaxID=314043 RepID=A0AA40CE42_9PEZI|nr:hypothetical protein B0T14DRAFT_534061 [Immersiella caudata]